MVDALSHPQTSSDEGSIWQILKCVISGFHRGVIFALLGRYSTEVVK
jgi:hypothetical protein